MDTTEPIDFVRELSYPTTFATSPLFPLLLISLSLQRSAPRLKSIFRSEYDYIIVGGGTAGSVVASRLSEIPCVSVLLLEAGSNPPLITEVPAEYRRLEKSDVDWKFLTTPQRYTGAGVIDRRIPWPSGRIVGGGSSMGSMAYVRGNRQNYDDWARQGAAGWSYEDVLPYFIKMEDYRVPEATESEYHGYGGPIAISKEDEPNIADEAIRRAVENLGYEFSDVNAESQTGFYDNPLTTRNGQRCSTAKAYLVPAENRTNLDIVANAFATKILIRNKQAVGVEFEFRNTLNRIRARREVVVSAGTVKTPQLLMLSGIGPTSELAKFNVSVIENLPVGQNLQDHAGSILSYVLNSNVPRFYDEIRDPENLAEYINNRTGPLNAIGSYLRAFLPNNDRRSPMDSPDHMLYLLDLDRIVAREQVNFRDEVFEQYFGPHTSNTTVTCVAQTLHPASRGTITLNSTNPYDQPLIDPNYFADNQDLQDIVQGLRSCNRLMSDPAMRAVGTQPFENLMPGCEGYAGNTQEYLTCVVRTFVVTTGHYVGTAKMGHPNDRTAVVDPQLRVKNIRNLRVVDASIMPTIPWGPTLIPTIMVAEKASDIIKETIDCDD
ncbi:glucose dehydrogenase [FAD, quinone]-like [Uloborus diversus]|uniref:glucose dehydrogenase [FAD, quinone]-like n=1 Tax=Uloborus diversus TaxID=327109 RepID=UPI002409E811|nr:glucose dehydrogenase [FAD, quinone]-like [Uloborus diversus]XP_054715632.1 glucose dehydrogenase [FAD, quinone]-like [Uloborus diversus]XP_054715633.1 glucose dehydrogenase [FAD, quinone]-like [Uloborus diversus]